MNCKLGPLLAELFARTFVHDNNILLLFEFERTTICYNDVSYLSSISEGPLSMPMISRSWATASRNASSQYCMWSQRLDRSLAAKPAKMAKFGLPGIWCIGAKKYYGSSMPLIRHKCAFIRIAKTVTYFRRGRYFHGREFARVGR